MVTERAMEDAFLETSTMRYCVEEKLSICNLEISLHLMEEVSPAPAQAPPAPAKETPVPAPAAKAPPAPAPVPVSQPPPAPAPVPTKHKRRRRHKHPQSKAAIVDLQPPSSFSSHLAMCSSHLEIDVGLMFGDRTLEEKLFHGMQGCREVYAIM
ncbi:hypothetical protein QYF36_014101 [Acer negundo]|nr:hypothetical protein QYF36_014101 [Acer negundo]